MASGKTTIAKILSTQSKVAVVDADRVAWETYNPGTEVYKQLVERFGEEILNEDTTINREALGKRVFESEENRLFLNSVVHPAVRQRYKELADDADDAGAEIFIIEAALLLDREVMDRDFFDAYVLAAVDEVEQLRRVLDRGRWTEDEARVRIASQASQEVKASRADYVIDTTCSMAETVERAQELFVWLSERYQAKKTSN